MQQIEYFLAIFYDNIYTFFGFVIDYVITNFITIIEYIKNINYYALVLRLLILYSNVTSQTYKFCKKIYNDHPVIKDVVNRVIYSKNYIIAVFNNHKIQPYYKNWMCTSVLIETKPPFYLDDLYQFNDTYEFINDEDDIIVTQKFNDNALIANAVLRNSSDINSLMISLKYNSSYLHRLINKERINYNVLIPPIVSSIKFISIEYTNSNIKNSIFIDLDKHEYIIGNEILSPIFIKRYICYQEFDFKFNYDYILKIIDTDLNTIELRSNQYILLHSDTYEIITG